MRNLLLIVWFVIMFSAAGFGDVVYLRRQKNSAVEFSCVSTNVNAKPFAFSLMRDLVKPEKVLYVHFGNSPSIFNEKDKNRFDVQVDSSHHQVTVNFSHLLGRHTDLYRCVFHYDLAKFEDYPGKLKFFLYVEDSRVGDVMYLSRQRSSSMEFSCVHECECNAVCVFSVPEECSCYSNEPLLYALSTVAALLFLCVLIFSGVYCERSSSSAKITASVIYEEMNEVRTMKGKVSSCHFSIYLKEQEETETSVYTLPLKKKPYELLPGSDPNNQ